MRNATSIRGGLLRDTVLVVVLVSGAVVALALHASNRATASLARAMLAGRLAQAESSVRSLFAAGDDTLRTIAAWSRNGSISLGDPGRAATVLHPLLPADGAIAAIRIADDAGRLLELDGRGAGTAVRAIRRAAGGAFERRFAPGAGAQPAEIVADLDPRDTDWYRRAAAAGDDVAWSRPRPAPGGGSARIDALARAPGGPCIAVVLDLAAAGAIGARRGGVVVVLAGSDRRLLALPPDAPADAAPAASLDTLAAPVSRAAETAIARAGPGSQAVRFEAMRAAWWAAARIADTGGDGVRLIAYIHEGDVIEQLPPVIPWIVAMLGAVLALATWRALVVSHRYSGPIESLVAESDRISRGDLDPGEPIASSIEEIRRLAEAHERMRTGLSALVRLEGDLELARRIQQNTLPERLPYLHGFDVDAFSEPAERAGGDIYDVVGFRARAGGRGLALAPDDAELALLLLADATGHGIGPALSATQVRAMLRMAARSGAPLDVIVRQINEQLCDDLFGGRFITAWIGLLDTRTATLASFSAGQGPLLHYHAREGITESIDADTPPLGIDRDLAVAAVAPRTLEPGDLFAVLSDGITDTTDRDGERFGEDRVRALIERHHAETPGLVVTRLRQALAGFAAGVPADDDRTAIIVKREAL